MLSPFTVPVPTLDRITFDSPSIVVQLDEALAEVFGKFGLPRLGGASGMGWSRFATMQRCWHLYQRSYVTVPREQLARRTGGALEVGSALHAFLAVYYSCLRDDSYPLGVADLHRGLLDAGADAGAVQEAWRLYEAYESHYSADVLIPLGIEEYARDEATGITCRYDMIARVDEATLSLSPGTWIVEHKSAARFDNATARGWANDGEIIGQMLLWERTKLAEKYGPLKGVIVNVVGKQKIPQFDRIVIPPQSWQIEAHARDLAYWYAQEQLHRSLDRWPRSRAACVTRYGLCPHFDVCANEPTYEEKE